MSVNQCPIVLTTNYLGALLFKNASIWKGIESILKPKECSYEQFCPSVKISVFFEVESAILHGASPFLVCELFGGEWGGKQQDFVKFAFWPSLSGEKWPFLVPKMKISVFFTVESAILHESSPFLVCDLFGSEWGLKQQDFDKFAF